VHGYGKCKMITPDPKLFMPYSSSYKEQGSEIYQREEYYGSVKLPSC